MERIKRKKKRIDHSHQFGNNKEKNKIILWGQWRISASKKLRRRALFFSSNQNRIAGDNLSRGIWESQFSLSLSLSQNEWMCVCVCVYIVGYSGRVSQRLAWVNKQAVALRLDSRWKRANADACHFLFFFLLLCASIRYCCQQLCDCHSAAACCPQSRRMAQSFCSLRWDGYCV